MPKDLCFCGHTRSDHRNRQQFRPRGGLNQPGSTCVEFQTVGGGPVGRLDHFGIIMGLLLSQIETFHQQCICGGRYSEHLPCVAVLFDLW